MRELALFEKARDKATGFMGTVVGIATFPHGRQYLLAALDKDGAVREEWVTYERAELVKEAK